jgi:putative transposase
VTRVCDERGLSQRPACRLVGIDHSRLRYQARRADDQPIRQRLRELAAVRRRFGYRRLGWLLVREGCRMNHKKLYRLYHEEKLMVRRRGGHRRALGTRAPMLLPERINQRWSLDFIDDTLSDGRRFRILCVVDDFSRECLACVVDTSLSGVRVVRELERLTDQRATPEFIVSDNGSELTSVAVPRWVPGRVAWHYIEPGKPVQNAFIRLRYECLNEHLFDSLAEACKSSKPGGSITIVRVRIPVSKRSRPASLQSCKGTVRLSKLRAPRPIPLLNRPNRGTTSDPKPEN